MGATLWFLFLAIAATGPALFGSWSLGPESVLDSNPLYALGPAPPGPLIPDASRTVYDLPRDFAIADGLGGGRLDLWNPRVGFGAPLWADGGAPFFPLKLPFYLAPSRRTYDLATALRLLIAGLGAYLLARRRGLGVYPALAAGSLFELSGSMMTMLQFGSGAPPCLLPWVVLGAEVIARERSLSAAAGTGIALGVAADSGHPMLAVVVFGAFGAAIAGHVLAAWQRVRSARTIAVLACLAVVVGLAVGAPMLLPLIELMSVGRLYKHVVDFGAYKGIWVLFSRHLLPAALFAPFLVASMRPRLAIALPYALSPVIGLLGLVLALTGLLRRGLGAGLLAVALFGVGMTLAPPGLSWVRHLPLLRDVWPNYCWSLLALPLSQAAGQGVATLETPGERWVLLASLAVVLAGSSSLFLLQDASTHLLLVNGVDLAIVLPVRQAFLAEIADRAGWLRLAVPTTLVTTVVVGLVAWKPTHLTRRAALVTGLAALELLVTLAPTTWYADSKVLASAPSAAVRFLQERLAAGRYRMLGWPKFLGAPSAPSLFGLPDVRANAPLPVERYVRYLEAISPASEWYVMQGPARARHPLLDLGAVRYVVRSGTLARSDQLDDDPELRRIYRDERLAIYENAAALSRARIVHFAVPVRDQEEAFARLTETAGAGAHAAAVGLTDRIFVEPSTDGRSAPAAPEATLSPDEDVKIVAGGDPDRVELLASLASPGWVVLADTFYPGWTATIDGVATPIYPANLLFRAVFVQPGVHRIVFGYEPCSFRLGVALALLGMAASGFLLIRKDHLSA